MKRYRVIFEDGERLEVEADDMIQAIEAAVLAHSKNQNVVPTHEALVITNACIDDVTVMGDVRYPMQFGNG